MKKRRRQTLRARRMAFWRTLQLWDEMTDGKVPERQHVINAVERYFLTHKPDLRLGMSNYQRTREQLERKLFGDKQALFMKLQRS